VEMATRMRRFMHQQAGAQLREDASQALRHLSLALQVEITLHIHQHWLRSVWFVRGLDEAFKVRLAQVMEPVVLAPGEVAPLRHLYVILRGSVIFGGRVLSRGAWWGDDVILTDERAFLPFLARALTFVDVNSLSADKVAELVKMYPVADAYIRKKVIMLSLRRTLVALAKEEKRRARTASGIVDSHENSLSRHRGDFVDRFGLRTDEHVDVQTRSMNIALYLEGRPQDKKQQGFRRHEHQASALTRLQAMQGEHGVALKEVQDQVHGHGKALKDVQDDVVALRHSVEDMKSMLRQALDRVV